jgi:Cys-rich protein (TIGR01571 family)
LRCHIPRTPSLPPRASLRYATVLGSTSLCSIVFTNSKSQIISIVQHELCSCCDVITKGLFWMACCCTPITSAQLLTRMGLNWYGKPGTPELVAKTFSVVVTIFIVYLLFGWVIPFLGAFFVIYTLVYGTLLRQAIRTKYAVPATSCGGAGDGCCEDCCCTFWCGCCTVIQLARQTHNEDQYPYQCCTSTGLLPDAPSIV